MRERERELRRRRQRRGTRLKARKKAAMAGNPTATQAEDPKTKRRSEAQAETTPPIIPLAPPATESATISPVEGETAPSA